MKNKLLSINNAKGMTYYGAIFFLIGALLAVVSSVEVNAKGPKGGDEYNEADRAKMHAKLLEKFDVNGDGKLDESERAEAKSFRKEHGKGKMRDKMRGKILKEFDANGDGKLDETEKAEAKKAMLEKWDKDGDGELSEDERAARREEFKKRMQERKEAKKSA